MKYLVLAMLALSLLVAGCGEECGSKNNPCVEPIFMYHPASIPVPLSRPMPIEPEEVPHMPVISGER